MHKLAGTTDRHTQTNGKVSLASTYCRNTVVPFISSSLHCLVGFCQCPVSTQAPPFCTFVLLLTSSPHFGLSLPTFSRSPRSPRLPHSSHSSRPGQACFDRLFSPPPAPLYMHSESHYPEPGRKLFTPVDTVHLDRDTRAVNLPCVQLTMYTACSLWDLTIVLTSRRKASLPL
ncbi:unnamed protein product [Protopolystoma xenopodis]|uniref:Uncharacterized protein n=1 Tax=Protopolystoma xenopodis TaxID=117903 RepID=A0A448WI62_9PLAT|nr:unnamed protein product [Protopolystoma xenopodis]